MTMGGVIKMHAVLPELLIVVAIIVALCGPRLTVLLARHTMALFKHDRQTPERHEIER